MTQSLIINSPFEIPTRHWRYNEQANKLELCEGRRQAEYVMFDTRGKQGTLHPNRRSLPLKLANTIRPLVAEWRQADYPGISVATRLLLRHWQERETDDRKFFFCQIEAIETLIWLMELEGAKHNNINLDSDGGEWERLCCKLATGTGKTVIMAMTVAWQAANYAANPNDKRFCRDVLVVAPGLTVKDRLSVINPAAAANYYDEFNIVPPEMMECLRTARVKIVNWHALQWDSEENIRKRRSVDKRGTKSDHAYTLEVLGDMADTRRLLVFNDEAHHAWRQNPELRGVGKDDKETATVWINALDRLHRARGIAQCLDFSATPFIPTGHANIEKTVYQWIVSDFGLYEAIESGLVKTPRLVVKDDALPDAKTYRSKLWHIYADESVKSDMGRSTAKPTEPLPDLVRNGYALLNADWQECRKNFAKKGYTVPPVMVSVLNHTAAAERVYHALSEESLPSAPSYDKTLKIDSKELKKAERDSNDKANERAQQLRAKVNTIGSEGKPGEQYQHVISVAMLSEGWDAKTVTHIMGLRAFNSQLLCEQVVGRGLRRMSYDVDKNGYFAPEYVNVFGVPFDIISPVDEEQGGNMLSSSPQPKLSVEVLSDRAGLEISWPNVVSVKKTLRHDLTVNWSEVTPLVLRDSETIHSAELGAMVDGALSFSDLTKIDIKKINEEFRLQKYIFQMANQALQEMEFCQGGQMRLTAQLIKLAEEFMHSDKMQFAPPIENTQMGDMRRRLLGGLNISKVLNHFKNAVVHQPNERLKVVLNPQKPIGSTGDMRPWKTGRNVYNAKKSHINRCVCDSTWEYYLAGKLDDMPEVKAWVKNDHLYFDVYYLHQGTVRKYRPDFIIRLNEGIADYLILEVKGQANQMSESKHSAAKLWTQAVNKHGGFGRWHFVVATDADKSVHAVREAANSTLFGATAPN